MEHYIIHIAILWLSLVVTMCYLAYRVGTLIRRVRKLEDIVTRKH